MTTWLTKNEVAAYLRRSTRTIDKWIKANQFPRGRYNLGRPYWSAKQIDDWLNKKAA